MTARPGQKRAVLLGILAAGALVAAAHWPMLSAGALSLDDSQFLTENELVQNPGWDSARRFFVEVLEPSTVGGYYLPLSMVSLMLDYARGGRPDALEPFHRTSLAVHVFNVGLVVLLLYLLFGNPWSAAAVGLCFGVHPLTVEPTIWVGERKTLLATFFALASLVAYVRYAQRSSKRFLWAAVAAFVLSLLSKPTATTLPILLLLMDVWPLGRIGRRALLEKIPFVVVAALSAAVTLLSHARTAELTLPDSPTPFQSLLMACRNLVFYFYSLVWPVDLASYYHVPEPLSLSQPAVLAGVIGVVVLAVVLGVSTRWSRAPVTAVAFFVVALLPTLGFVRYSWVLVADKYLYFPVIGLLMLLASALRRVRIGTGAGACMLAGVLLVGTLETRLVRAYQARWQDSETLFRHMVDAAPEAPRAHDMYGKLLLQRLREDDAMQYFRQAVAIDSLYAPAYVDIGNVLFRRNDLANAMQHWQKALAANAEFAAAHTCLGVGLSRLGRADEAVASFENALRLDPGDPYALNNLGIERFRRGQVPQAAALFTKAIGAKTNYADARVNLGVALARSGRPEEALVQYQAAERFGADPVIVRRHMAGVYLQTQRPGNAATLYRDLVARRPDDAMLRNNYALSLIQVRRLDEALQQARAAVALDSAYVDARFNLAFILEQRGDTAGAVDQYRAILALQPDHAAASDRLRQALERPDS